MAESYFNSHNVISLESDFDLIADEIQFENIFTSHGLLLELKIWISGDCVAC